MNNPRFYCCTLPPLSSPIANGININILLPSFTSDGHPGSSVPIVALAEPLFCTQQRQMTRHWNEWLSGAKGHLLLWMDHGNERNCAASHRIINWRRRTETQVVNLVIDSDVPEIKRLSFVVDLSFPGDLLLDHPENKRMDEELRQHGNKIA